MSALFGGIFSLLLVVGGFFALLFIFLKSLNIGGDGDKKNKSSNKKVVDNKTLKYLKDLEEEERVENKNTKKFSDYENSIMNKVKRLKILYKNGTLSKSEFEKAKNKLLK